MTNQDEKNASVFAHLSVLGDKAPVKRPTDFYFYGEPEFIETLGGILARRGFEIRPTVPQHPGLIATIAMSMEGDSFNRTANWLASLAGDLGVEFDGWETELVGETH